MITRDGYHLIFFTKCCDAGSVYEWSAKDFYRLNLPCFYNRQYLSAPHKALLWPIVTFAPFTMYAFPSALNMGGHSRMNIQEFYWFHCHLESDHIDLFGLHLPSWHPFRFRCWRSPFSLTVITMSCKSVGYFIFTVIWIFPTQLLMQ